MRRKVLPSAKPCAYCGEWFFGRPNQRACRKCAEKRKKASDSATHKASRGRPPYEADLSPGQIEAVFQEALAEIRRERRFTADERSSHAWKYTEPGR
jgi:hypothetical protein